MDNFEEMRVTVPKACQYFLLACWYFLTPGLLVRLCNAVTIVSSYRFPFSRYLVQAVMIKLVTLTEFKL